MPQPLNEQIANGDPLLLELIEDEGVRMNPYKDSLGYMTIGVGHLIGKGEKFHTLTPDECRELLIKDVEVAKKRLSKIFPQWTTMDPVRQRAMVNLTFNLGNKLAEFKQTLGALSRQDWKTAAAHLRASLWSKQVKGRTGRICRMIAEGVR